MMKNQKTIVKTGLAAIFPLMFCFFLSGCGSASQKTSVSGPMTYTRKVDLRINGFRRTYRVHLPPAYRPEKPLPLVVVIHGAFDTAKGMEKASGFSQLADEKEFIVTYPNGMGLFGYLQHWNAGHCCGKAAGDNLDDVGFIAATIEDACSHLSVDRRRIYMVGFSNGGMMAYRFAAERGDLLAAVAPLAASIGGRSSAEVPEWRISEPVRPLPVITFHGMEDNDIRYEGGRSEHRGGTRTYWSVERSVGFWVRRNQCAGQVVEQYLNNKRVHLRSWGGCEDNAEVALYLIDGWGHVWPGKHFTSALPPDDALRNFDAAKIIWDFFSAHRRQP